MSDRSFHRAVTDWLEDGSDRTPPAAIDAVLLAVKTTPQERDLRIPRRFTVMPTYMRLAAGIAIVAIAGVATVSFLNRGSSPGIVPPPSSIPSSIPSSSPSASPSSPAISTADWTAYTSERYGFDMKRPRNWAETLHSDHVWTLAEAANVQSTATEDFYYPGLVDGQGVRVSTWSVGAEPGMSLDGWLQAYCSAATGSPCPGALDQGLPVSFDGHAGVSLAGPAKDSQAFALVNDRVYVVKAWRSEDDPSVAAFGGGRRLIEAFVSTIRLRPGGPAPTASPPALTESFTSDRYGFSLKVPSGWTAAPAIHPWNPSTGGWSDDQLDFVNAPSESGWFRAVSAVVPDGLVIDDWIDQKMTFSADAGCGTTRATLAHISIDGRTGAMQTACDQVEASVVVGRRVYLFTLWAGESASYTSSARALFEAMMATVRLTPDSADVVPSAKPS